MNKSRFTPLMRFSIFLTLGITTAQYSSNVLTTGYWLLATLCVLAVAISLKKHFLYQSYAIYICVTCIGGSITAQKIEQSNTPISVNRYEELTSIDKTLLYSQSLRNNLERKLQELQIKDQDYAIMAAMALGDKSELGQETKENYSISGASHILAVSGLHISIIFQAFILLLGGKRRSILSISLPIIAIWTYVIFIGMPASALRSATMISIYSFALLAKKDALSVNNLAFAYCIMLFINPLYLFDISFQMSFVAVLSILTLYPLIVQQSHPHHVGVKWIWNVFCVSLSAQIGTFPLIAYYFGRYSCYGVLTNFVAIPGATLILYLSMLLLLTLPFTGIGFISTLATSITQYIAKILVLTTQSLNAICKVISQLPGSCIDNIQMSKLLLFMLYVSIIIFYCLLKRLQRNT